MRFLESGIYIQDFFGERLQEGEDKGVPPSTFQMWSKLHLTVLCNAFPRMISLHGLMVVFGQRF